MHPLRAMLVAAAAGSYPPADGNVTVMAPMAGDHHAIVEFTGHAVVVTDCSTAEVEASGADGFGGAVHPDVVRRLAGTDGWIGSHDAVLVATGVAGERPVVRSDLDDHPRVVRAREHRRDVRVHGDDTGLVTIGQGLVDRVEVSVETFEPGRGHGARLIRSARALVQPGSLLWAQVAPGNTASLRAFLTAGFVPIGAEILLRPTRSDTAPVES